MKSIDCHDLYADGRHYDLITGDFIADLPFYRRMIGRTGDPVLELCCGTGRLTVPLSAEGYRVTGIDISESMLRYGQLKADAAGVSPLFVQADIRDFAINERFAFAFIPINSFLHCHDKESVEAVLRCVRAHLTPEGLFVIDIFVPGLDVLTREPDRHYPVATYADPDGRGTVDVTETNRYAASTQIKHILWHFRIAGSSWHQIVENNMRIFFPAELDAILEYNGFEIIEKYGTYDGGPFTDASQKNLIVCRPTTP